MFILLFAKVLLQPSHVDSKGESCPVGDQTVRYIVSFDNLPCPISCAFHGNLPNPIFSLLMVSLKLSPEISHLGHLWVD